MDQRPERIDVAEAMAVLERTPATLSALLGGLPGRWVQATEGNGTWSPYDVVGHLVHGEQVNWVPRLKHILANKQEPFEPFDRTAFFALSQGKSLEDLLASFHELRQQNLTELRGLPLSGAELERTGSHPDLGQVRLGHLLATWAVHDLDHIAQIVRTMAKLQSRAVGPWSKFLSILRDREKGTVSAE